MIGDNKKLTKPNYYKVLWHNCNRCKTHYTSETPHLKAYLCDDCWSAIPHFVVQATPVVKKKKKDDWNWSTIALYTLGHLCCLAVIGYYLLFRQEKTMYRKCRRCNQHMSVYHDDVCSECREEERQRNFGE